MTDEWRLMPLLNEPRKSRYYNLGKYKVAIIRCKSISRTNLISCTSWTLSYRRSRYFSPYVVVIEIARSQFRRWTMARRIGLKPKWCHAQSENAVAITRQILYEQRYTGPFINLITETNAYLSAISVSSRVSLHLFSAEGPWIQSYKSRDSRDCRRNSIFRDHHQRDVPRFAKSEAFVVLHSPLNRSIKMIISFQ